MLDSRGLIFEGRADIHEDKRAFALSAVAMARYVFSSASQYDLETVIRHVAPTILIGTSGTPGAFGENAIRQMAARTGSPIIFPLSNPTSKSEATPAEVLRWIGGRALVATGSPFEPVGFAGRTRQFGQANNVFIFRGVGLGVVVAQARKVTDSMFLAAAETLASLVTPDRISAGALYPRLADLREVSRAIAIAVAEQARECGVARLAADQDVAACVAAAMWTPDYRPQ